MRGKGASFQVAREVTMPMLPNKGQNKSAAGGLPGAQRSLEDLERRLAALEAVVSVSGGDVAITVPNNLALAVGANATLTVGRDYTLSVARNFTSTVTGESRHTYGYSYIVTINGISGWLCAGRHQMRVAGECDTQVGGGYTQSVTGPHRITGGRELVFYSSGKIYANQALTIT
jgi:hypothetical protein